MRQKATQKLFEANLTSDQTVDISKRSRSHIIKRSRVTPGLAIPIKSLPWSLLQGVGHTVTPSMQSCTTEAQDEAARLRRVRDQSPESPNDLHTGMCVLRNPGLMTMFHLDEQALSRLSYPTGGRGTGLLDA
jgi:hypothetical protein